jgi:hypothetical protein
MTARRRSATLAGTAALVLATVTLGVGPAHWAAATSAAGSHAAAAQGNPRFPFCHALLPFSPHNFPARPRSTNPWLPLRPGLWTTVSGTAEADNGDLHAHSTTMRVSDVVKHVAGVAARVVYEQDWDQGALQESELTLAAEDRSGNVWLLGEYPEEWSDGAPEGAPDTWVAPLKKARPGVIMPAHPRLGMPGYAQAFAPSVEFRDCARITAVARNTCTKLMCFNKVLVTREWSPLDPQGGFQVKYYVRGLGNVKVGELQGTGELMTLHRAAVMPANIRAHLNAAVLAQDRRGYRINPHVWGRTPRGHCAGRYC